MSRGSRRYPGEMPTPDTRAGKFESLERINSIRETNRSFDSCNSCKRLVPSRLHELHESKLLFVSRIEFIRSKLSNFPAHVPGSPCAAGTGGFRGRPAGGGRSACLCARATRPVGSDRQMS